MHRQRTHLGAHGPARAEACAHAAAGHAEGAVSALPGGRRPVVLHVVEAFGGGVAAAVRDYARAVPECEHHLL